MVADVCAKGLHVLYRGFLKNAVAEIEDVARASSSAAQNVFRARLDFFPLGEKQHGIEIALHRALVAEALPSGIERNTPVEADNLGARFLHGRQKRGTISSEIDNGHARFL